MRFWRVVRAFRNWPLHYLNQAGLLGGSRAELVTRDGVRLRVRTYTSDFRTSRSVMADRSYFFGGVTLARDAVVLDAGAHIGSFAMLAAARAPEGRVLAFEPEAANFEMLRQNADLNGFGHVRAFNLAVAGADGPRTLHYSLKPTTTGGHSLVRTGERSTTVECIRFDRIVEENGLTRIDFLKLDCEGAELEFLAAASPASLAMLRRGAIEIHSDENRTGVSRLLEGAGCRLFGGPKSNYLYFVR